MVLRFRFDCKKEYNSWSFNSFYFVCLQSNRTAFRKLSFIHIKCDPVLPTCTASLMIQREAFGKTSIFQFVWGFCSFREQPIYMYFISFNRLTIWSHEGVHWHWFQKSWNWMPHFKGELLFQLEFCTTQFNWLKCFLNKTCSSRDRISCLNVIDRVLHFFRILKNCLLYLNNLYNFNQNQHFMHWMEN